MKLIEEGCKDFDFFFSTVISNGWCGVVDVHLVVMFENCANVSKIFCCQYCGICLVDLVVGIGFMYI